MRGQIEQDIGLIDVEFPAWPFLVLAGLGGLAVGVLIGKILG